MTTPSIQLTSSNNTHELGKQRHNASEQVNKKMSEDEQMNYRKLRRSFATLTSQS